MLSRRKQGGNILYIFKKKICTTVISHVNSSESDHLNTSNSDNAIINSKLPRINVPTESRFNTLITLQKETDTESNIIINDEIIDKKMLLEKCHLIIIQKK